MHFNLVRSSSDFQLAPNFKVRRLLEGSAHSHLIVKKTNAYMRPGAKNIF